MGSKTRILSAGELHPRENLWAVANIAAANSEVIVNCDGCSSVAIDIRGTFNLTLEVAGTIDDINWTPIVMMPKNQNLKLYVASISGSTPGLWVGGCAGFRKVRARCVAWSSGNAITVLSASTAPFDPSLDGLFTANTVTATGAAGAAVTLTLPSPGSGLRHYITYLEMVRFNATAAALAASTAPVICTTTNLPGSLAFTRAADALAPGATESWRENFRFPLLGSAQNSSTTIICPATTGVIWRATAGFNVGP